MNLGKPENNRTAMLESGHIVERADWQVSDKKYREQN